MNRDEILRLLSAERDGALGAEERARLDRALAVSPEARALRAEVEAAMTAFRLEAEGMRVPDADDAWRTLEARLARPAPRRRVAPVAWFALPLAAAAAVAVAFLGLRPIPTGVPADPEAGVYARADFVELADASATPVVFVDKESGWLVVWAEAAEQPAE
jgi:anti-sigma factor RsiW